MLAGVFLPAAPIVSLPIGVESLLSTGRTLRMLTTNGIRWSSNLVGRHSDVHVSVHVTSIRCMRPF